MPQITFNEWKAGLDVRQGESVSADNKLRVANNVFINTGGVPQKRPAIIRALSLPATVHGLASMDGQLHVFYDAQHSAPSVSGVVAHALTSVAGTPDIKAIHYAEHFNGFLYVVAEYTTGVVQHHFLDGSGDTRVTDVNCPQTKVIIKKGQRLYASASGAGNVVRYCAGADPRDWTPEAEPAGLDAGFLPVNIQADGSDRVLALGNFQSYLVVFTADHAQLWLVDADQLTNAFTKLVYAGVKGNAVAGMAGDLFFLSTQGVRSMGYQYNTDSVVDIDVGTPIDNLMQQHGIPKGMRYVRRYGQLFVWFDEDVTTFYGDTVQGTRVYVYSYSRTSKISAWTCYLLPIRIDQIIENENVVYLITGTDVFMFSDNHYMDFATDAEEQRLPIWVKMEMPFLDFKTPTITKQIVGADFIIQGTAQFSTKFDLPDATIETVSQNITGNSMPRGLLPMEVCSTAIAPVIEHIEDEPFRLDAMAFHYFNLGAL